MQKRLLSLLLIISFVSYSSCSFLEGVTQGNNIWLREPMITADGHIVHEVYLPSGTAAILRSMKPIDANPTAVDDSPGEGSVPTRPGKSIRLGGYFFGKYGDGTALSQKQLSWISEHLDVLVLNALYTNVFNGFKGGCITPAQVAWMKKQHNDFRFYSMLYATTLIEPVFDPAIMSDWVVRNKAGKEALGIRRESDADIHHMMDLGNKDYAEYFRKLIIDHANEYHADGVAIDEVMWNGYWGVDIRDMRDYSSVEQVRQTCYDWLKRIKENNPKAVIHQAFWPQAQLHTDGVWGEGAFYTWFRAGTDYEIFYNTMDYKQIVENIAEHSRRNETYVWAANYKRGDAKELEYALATYLLGKSGPSVVFHPHPGYDGGYPNNLAGYDISTVMEEYDRYKALFDVELGNPVGDMYTEKMGRSQVWARKYENGIVYCNPNSR
jgi:hypothetical protein